MNRFFDIECPDAIYNILKSAAEKGTKLRMWYGDKKTGKDWGEIFDTYGYIGKSYGKSPIPILLKRKDSKGGCAILADCIVKITIDKEVVYQHPNFKQSNYEIQDASDSLKKHGFLFSVFADGENIYNCKTRKQAENEIAFHMGIRNVIWFRKKVLLYLYTSV